MTWLGKILTFVVFLGAIVWAYFTIQTFSLRTNWKAELERYKTEFKKMETAHRQALRDHEASEAVLQVKLASEEKRSDDLNKQVRELSDNAGKTKDQFTVLQKAFDDGDATATKLMANIAAMTAEVAAVRARNNFLEDDRVRQVIAAETARREMVRAQNAEKLAQAIADDNAKKIEELIIKNTELRATGGSGNATVLRSIEKPPPPVLPNLRGEVKAVSGDLLTVSIGLDSGLAVGTVLDVFRLEPRPRYLGTVKVISSYDLHAKEAVMMFTPANKLPLERLGAEDLPRAGDLVKPLEGTR